MKKFLFPLKAARKKLYETYSSVKPGPMFINKDSLVTVVKCKEAGKDPVKVRVEIQYWGKEKSNVFFKQVS